MADAFLHQSLSQQQTLAPQMRKSLEILQAGTLELSQLVRQALETNPVLEDLTETVSLDEEGPDPEQADSLDYMNQTDDDWRDRTILEGKSSPWTSEDEERRQRVYDSIVAPETLQQHLQHQLDLSMVDPKIREAAQAILGNLDDRGFLDLPAKTLGTRMGLRPEHVAEALELVQSFDPVGIGATGIPESLLLQLEHTTGKETIEYKIVRDHLEDLARKRHPQIARSLGTTVERIAEAASRIGRLTPNPGGEYDPTGNPYILPDIIIERDDDGHWYNNKGVVRIAGVLSQMPAAAKITERIPTPFIENGKPVTLEVVIYKPAGNGPFPALMFNHGSTGNGDNPALFTSTWTSAALAKFFTDKGWLVAFPQRRGRGKSDGLYDEGFEADRSRYSCDPQLSLPGLERALSDMDAAYSYVAARADIDSKRMLVGGQSRGGIAASVYAGTRPARFAGVLNFVGGWLGDDCPNVQAVNTVSFRRGAKFGLPMLWLYGENDPYYKITHSKRNFDAFIEAGGKGEFKVYDLGSGRNGHNIISQPELWGSAVDAYLKLVGMQSDKSLN